MVQQAYQTASRQLIGQARSELDAGDVRQASEKGWGAAAQMVKAVGEQRGWAHRGHAQLFRIVERLVSETGDADISNLFQVASGLHHNFYEDWDTAQNVGRGLGEVERFLDKLEPMLAGG